MPFKTSPQRGAPPMASRTRRFPAAGPGVAQPAPVDFDAAAGCTTDRAGGVYAEPEQREPTGAAPAPPPPFRLLPLK